MNPPMLQRLTYVVLPLCTLIVMALARAAEPPSTPDTPASVAPAPEDTQERMRWHDRFDRHEQSGWHSRHGRHSHHEYGSELVNIRRDSNRRRGETAHSGLAV